MQFSEFVQAYSRETPTPKPSRHDEHPDIVAGRQYSGEFGEVLHDRLSGRDTRTFGSVCLRFVPWFEDHYKDLFANLKAATDFEDTKSADEYYRIGNEFNWHGLSYPMTPSWLLLDRDPKDRPRLSEADIIVEQAILASSSLEFFLERNQDSDITNSHIYFSQKNAQKRRAYEGVINEIETALVLLEIQKKHPGLIIVPAPAQFEQTRYQGVNYNADFLAINALAQQVVGVQTKNNVSKDDQNEYDMNRIALVDGRIDLGNEKLSRTTPGKSNARMMVWPGLISMHVLNGLPTHGPSVSALESTFHKPTLMRYKTFARALVGTSTNNLRVAAERVTDRLEPHIGLSTLRPQPSQRSRPVKTGRR